MNNYAKNYNILILNSKKNIYLGMHKNKLATIIMKPLIQILLILFSLNCFGQSRNSFIDIRDSTEYGIITIDSLVWMTENLKFDTTGAFKYPESCDSCGLLYTYEASSYSCPEGFRLPTENEWNNLFKYYGGKRINEEYGIYFNGIKDSLINDSSINLKFCGFFRQNPFNSKPEREYSLCGTYSAFWFLNKSAFNGIHINNSTNSNWVGTVEGDNNSGFCVRCVKKQ